MKAFKLIKDKRGIKVKDGFGIIVPNNKNKKFGLLKDGDWIKVDDSKIREIKKGFSIIDDWDIWEESIRIEKKETNSHELESFYLERFSTEFCVWVKNHTPKVNLIYENKIRDLNPGIEPRVESGFDDQSSLYLRCLDIEYRKYKYDEKKRNVSLVEYEKLVTLLKKQSNLLPPKKLEEEREHVFEIVKNNKKYVTTINSDYSISYRTYKYGRSNITIDESSDGYRSGCSIEVDGWVLESEVENDEHIKTGSHVEVLKDWDRRFSEYEKAYSEFKNIRNQLSDEINQNCRKNDYPWEIINPYRTLNEVKEWIDGKELPEVER